MEEPRAWSLLFMLCLHLEPVKAGAHDLNPWKQELGVQHGPWLHEGQEL